MIRNGIVDSISILFLTAALFGSAALAQTSQPEQGIGFKEFIQATIEGNIGLVSQKYNVEIADAAISVAALAPDPTFTIGYSSYELSRFILPHSVVAAVNYTLENSDKRKARVRVAEADKALAAAQVNEYMKTLRFDAANAYIEAVKTRSIVARRKYTLDIFERLGQTNSQPPLKVEERAQLRLELARLRGDFHQSASDLEISNRNLNFYLGESSLNKQGVYANASLEVPAVQFVEADLQGLAAEYRPDIASAKSAMQSAQSKSELAQKNRSLDYGFALGVTHTQPMWSIPDAGGSYFPGSYPMSNALIATVTVPIPFSLLQDGDLRGPAATAVQAEMRLKELQSKARIEVGQAAMKYNLSLKQVSAYREGTADADVLMEDTLKKFAGQENGFPDIVYYIRTANEIHFAYLEALASSAKALISVYQVSGQWEFNF